MDPPQLCQDTVEVGLHRRPYWLIECHDPGCDIWSRGPGAVTTSQSLRVETVGTLQPIKREPQLTPELTNGPLRLPTPPPLGPSHLRPTATHTLIPSMRSRPKSRALPYESSPAGCPALYCPRRPPPPSGSSDPNPTKIAVSRPEVRDYVNTNSGG